MLRKVYRRNQSYGMLLNWVKKTLAVMKPEPAATVFSMLLVGRRAAGGDKVGIGGDCFFNILAGKTLGRRRNRNRRLLFFNVFGREDWWPADNAAAD